MFELFNMVFAITAVVSGYYAYKEIWEAEFDSEMPYSPEPDNREDRYAVGVMNGTDVVGHVPRRILIFVTYSFTIQDL